MDISKIITVLSAHKEQIIKSTLVVGSGLIGVALANLRNLPQKADEIIILEETAEPVLDEEPTEEDTPDKE